MIRKKSWARAKAKLAYQCQRSFEQVEIQGAARPVLLSCYNRLVIGRSHLAGQSQKEFLREAKIMASSFIRSDRTRRQATPHSSSSHTDRYRTKDAVFSGKRLSHAEASCSATSHKQSPVSNKKIQIRSTAEPAKTLAEQINWPLLAHPCKETLRGKLPAALAAREQLIYLQKRYPCTNDVNKEITSDIAHVSTALRTHVLEQVKSAGSLHGQYLTILCELHNENASHGDTIPKATLYDVSVDSDSLSLSQLKSLMPVYHAMTTTTQDALRTAHNRIVQELIPKPLRGFKADTAKKNYALDALHIIQKDLLPLQAIPFCQNIKDSLEQSIPELTEACIATYSNARNKIPIYQQLQDLLTLAAEQQWIQPDQAALSGQELLKILDQPKTFGVLTPKIVDCPSYQKPDNWSATPAIQIKKAQKKCHSVQDAFHTIDTAVMHGDFPSALANSCELWQESLLFMNQEDRTALCTRLNDITRILLTEMYSSIKEEPLPLTALTQQLEWLLSTLGQEAWSSALSLSVKGALTFLSHAVLQQILSEQDATDLDSLVTLMEHARSICYLADFVPEEHVKTNLKELALAKQLTATQKGALRRLLKIFHTRSHLPQGYKNTIQEMLAGRFSSTTIKTAQLYDLLSELQITSPAALLMRAETIAGPEPRGKELNDTIHQLRHKIIERACAAISIKLTTGKTEDLEDATTSLQEIRSLPGLTAQNLKQLEAIQAKTYLAAFDQGHKGADLLLPHLQPLIRLLLPNLNALEVSLDEYLSQVVHQLAACSAEAVLEGDAASYCKPLERLSVKSRCFCVHNNFHLPHNILSLMATCKRKAAAHQQKKNMS